MRTYSVVALSVNVKLVEKIAKSHDGKVMVVNVISQIRTPGITLMRDRNNCPTRLSKKRADDTSFEVVAVAIITTRETSGIAECA
jgi:hypothetical protein